MKLRPICFAPSAGCCGHRRNGNQKVDDIGFENRPLVCRTPAEPRQAEFRAAIEAEGNRLRAPVHGPAVGALIEAYRAAGLAVELLDVPEEKA